VALGEIDRAEELFASALAGQEAALGLTHPSTLRTAGILARSTFCRKSSLPSQCSYVVESLRTVKGLMWIQGP
jgi:hypothetical protein